jgi:hypothetical protein
LEKSEAEALVHCLEMIDPGGAPTMEVELPIPKWRMSMQEWSEISEGRMTFSGSEIEGYNLALSGGRLLQAGRRAYQEAERRLIRCVQG